MEADKIEDTIYRLEKLMYGYNYQVTFGLNIFEYCSSLDQFRRKLKHVYKDSKPEEVQLIKLNAPDLWEEIDYAFNYRGDSTAGLSLSETKEIALEKEKAKFKKFINEYITEETQLYSYPDEEGIPGYPVYWDFRFIILTKNNCLFVFGAASD